MERVVRNREIPFTLTRSARMPVGSALVRLVASECIIRPEHDRSQSSAGGPVPDREPRYTVFVIAQGARTSSYAFSLPMCRRGLPRPDERLSQIPPLESRCRRDGCVVGRRSVPGWAAERLTGVRRRSR